MKYHHDMHHLGLMLTSRWDEIRSSGCKLCGFV